MHIYQTPDLDLQPYAINALRWIVAILNKHSIPFQISGGLAANIYGSNRPLYDIDIDIPEDCYNLLIQDVSKYIIFGPALFQDNEWKLKLMTLKYEEQLIDLGGAYHTYIRNKLNQEWIHIPTDFNSAKFYTIDDITILIIDKYHLIEYKKIIARDTDLDDVAQIINNI